MMAGALGDGQGRKGVEGQGTGQGEGREGGREE